MGSLTENFIKIQQKEILLRLYLSLKSSPGVYDDGNVLDRAVQVHGALGMTDDTPLASLYRHERSARIYDGADEVHKSRVAKEIMKKYLK